MTAKCAPLTHHIGRPPLVSPPTASPCQQPPLRGHLDPSLLSTIKLYSPLPAWISAKLQMMGADSLAVANSEKIAFACSHSIVSVYAHDLHPLARAWHAQGIWTVTVNDVYTDC